MNTTGTVPYSETIIDQTALALEYLQRISDLIIYQNLVPQDEHLIDEYARLTGRTIPPDYRLWLTKIGSGTIDLVYGSIEIQSCIDIAMNEAVWIGWDLKPQDAWNRLPFKDNNNLAFFGADSTILNANGCCPITESGFLDQRIEMVHASSWPMYVIHRILKQAEEIGALEEADWRVKKIAADVCAIPFANLDTGLDAALRSAKAHNLTESTTTAHEASVSKLARGIKNYTEKHKLRLTPETDGITASIKYAAKGNSRETDISGCFATESIIDLFLAYLELAEKHPHSSAKVSALKSIQYLNRLYRERYAKKSRVIPEDLKNKLAGLQAQTRDIRVKMLIAKISQSKGVFS